MKTAVFLLLVSAACAQPLRVYSEFAKIDATGRVTAPDEPREILSPAIARNAFSSFQVVVEVPRGTPYQLYIAQNPEHAVVVTLYRENGERLEPVEQPVGGNGTQVFWMDLWTARDAPVARIKVEPQLHVNNDWVIYPMEARVVSATVPDGPRLQTEAMTPVERMRQYLCPRAGGYAGSEIGAASSVRGLQTRNGFQDLSLAAGAPRAELENLFGACDGPASPDPEWYLRIRDYLLRLR